MRVFKAALEGPLTPLETAKAGTHRLGLPGVKAVLRRRATARACSGRTGRSLFTGGFRADPFLGPAEGAAILALPRRDEGEVGAAGTCGPVAAGLAGPTESRYDRTA